MWAQVDAKIRSSGLATGQHSGNVILQQQTGTTHVSTFQLLLCSPPVGLGLLVGLLTSGVEHPANIVADAHDFVFEGSSAVASLGKLLIWFSSASPATPFISFNFVF